MKPHLCAPLTPEDARIWRHRVYRYATAEQWQQAHEFAQAADRLDAGSMLEARYTRNIGWTGALVNSWHRGWTAGPRLGCYA